jgi:hypothetical protein
MSTPAIKTRVTEENERWWVEFTVDGWYTYTPIEALSKENGERIAPQIRNLIEAVYRKAYRDGFGACQRSIKDALGIK